jgi:hypothetical protein
MPYVPRDLTTHLFLAGFGELYETVQRNPEMRMIPIGQLEPTRSKLKQLGYRFRVVYRGPHGRNRSTLKRNARAFNVYFKN